MENHCMDRIVLFLSVFIWSVCLFDYTKHSMNTNYLSYDVSIRLLKSGLIFKMKIVTTFVIFWGCIKKDVAFQCVSNALAYVHKSIFFQGYWTWQQICNVFAPHPVPLANYRSPNLFSPNIIHRTLFLVDEYVLLPGWHLCICSNAYGKLLRIGEDLYTFQYWLKGW